jgi:DNA-binding NarL/FixJ family response regulator
MPAPALPFPWNDYHQFQSAGDDRASNPASFGHDDALAALVDDLSSGGPPSDSMSLRSKFENLCCNRAAKYRRRIRLMERFAERQRSSQRESVQAQLAGRGPVSEDHAASFATAELLDLVRRCVSEPEWRILWMLAEGYSYGEIAAQYGVTVENLKSRTCRLRNRIRNSTVGLMVHAAMC